MKERVWQSIQLGDVDLRESAVSRTWGSDVNE